MAIRSTARARGGALEIGAAIASGAVAVLTVEPFALGWMIWFAFVPLLFAVDGGGSSGRRFLTGLCAGLTLFAGLSYGLVPNYPEAYALVVVGLAAVFAAVFALHSALRAASPPWLRPLLLPALWVLAERLSSTADAPWSASLTQAHHPLVLQSAALLGCRWISFEILLVNAALFETALALRAGGAAALGRGRAFYPALLAAVAVAASLAYGARTLADRGAVESRPPLTVAGIQPVVLPHVYAHQGLEPRYRAELRELIDDLSAEAASSRPDFLVWPEGGNGQYNFRIAARRAELARLARASGAALLVSSYDLDRGGRLFNAFYSLSPAGDVLGRYAKTRLTPFGERQFSPGATVEPLETPHGAIGVLVCFESTFPALARTLVAKGAELLVITSSDASFLDSSLPLLHSASAVFRAVENRRAVILASNAGPSLIVSPYGEITAATALFERGVFRGDVAMRSDRTLYSQLGEAPIIALCLAILGAGAWAALRPRRARAAARALDGRRRKATGLLAAGGSLAAALLAGFALAVVSQRLCRPAERDLAAFLRPPAASIRADTAREFLQTSPTSCGPAALAYLLSYLGVETRESDLAPLVHIAAGGASLADLAAAAEARGLDAWGEKQNWAALVETPKPVLAHVRGDHYVVVLALADDDSVDVFDPAAGYRRVSKQAFLEAWQGHVLLVRFRDDHPAGGPAGEARAADRGAS